jgi:hypothetical protein
MSDSFDLDLDGDGVADAVGFDGNGDGYAETVVHVDAAGQTLLIADTDGNGVYDTTGIDASGDGSFETIGVDTDEDGTIDEIATDSDGDGIADEYASADPGPYETDPTGTDPTDTEPTGTDPTGADTIDPGDPSAATTAVTDERFDVDGDGVVDHVVREIDLDGDRRPEVVDILADTDGDGRMDAEAIAVDEDLDGDADTVIIDGDLDGVAETTIYDRDGDDVADAATFDFDQDGKVDAVELDLDEDGHIDVVAVPGETLTLDESGHVIAVEPNAGDIAPGDTGDGDDPPPPDDTGPDDTGPDDSGPDDTVTPIDDGRAGDDVTDEPLVDPDTEMAEDSERWFKQSENGFCAPASVAFIVGEYTDAPIDEATFVDKAVEMGFLTETSEGWSGMTVDQTATLLEEFGVDATVETGTVDSLDRYLDHGYNAIVAIDSDDIWYGGEAGPDADGVDAANHAVVVSEIKDGYVYLLDPGTPDGNLEKVPVDVFEQAWSASGHEMVLTDNPDVDGALVTTDGNHDAIEAGRVTVGASSADAAGGSPFASESWVERAATAPGTLFIPVVIAGAAVRAWTSRND